MNIDEIADLAQLDLTAEERVAMERDLQAILAYVGQLDAIPTEGVDPMSQPLIADPPLRADEARSWFDQAQALANAPRAREGMFEVPRVLDRGKNKSQ